LVHTFGSVFLNRIFMRENKAAIIGVCVVFLFLVGTAIVSEKSRKTDVMAYETLLGEVYSKIQFKGKIIKVHEIRRWGRTYGMMCVKLDYTNTDSFYRLEKVSCLKIEKGIATIPVGFINSLPPNQSPFVYIEANINNNGKMIFIDSVGNRTERDLDYPSSNIMDERDMNICDECY